MGVVTANSSTLKSSKKTPAKGIETVSAATSNFVCELLAVNTAEVVFQLMLPTTLSGGAIRFNNLLPLMLMFAEAGFGLGTPAEPGFLVYQKLNRYGVPGVVTMFVEMMPSLSPTISIQFVPE